MHPDVAVPEGETKVVMSYVTPSSTHSVEEDSVVDEEKSDSSVKGHSSLVPPMVSQPGISIVFSIVDGERCLVGVSRRCMLHNQRRREWM